MKITYGTTDCNIDVTEICYKKLMWNNLIRIPNDDVRRAFFFTDPIYGKLKSIFITNNDNITTEYDATNDITIKIITDGNFIIDECINKKISDIHSKLQFKYGSLNVILPELSLDKEYTSGLAVTMLEKDSTTPVLVLNLKRTQ